MSQIGILCLFRPEWGTDQILSINAEKRNGKKKTKISPLGLRLLSVFVDACAQNNIYEKFQDSLYCLVCAEREEL